MNRSRRFERLLRWYPARWRERYRREMVALLEDTYGSRRIPWSARVSLMKNGSLERARGVGWVGDVASPSDRLKAGSTLIVSCWSLFVVAGAIFAKFSEHWNVLTPVADRPAANVGYNAVQWSGVVGVGLVGLGALLVLPILVRFLRAGGWDVVRRSVVRTVSGVVIALVATVGLAAWAHHLSSSQRNGSLWIYGVAFVVWCLGVVVLIGSGTATIVAATRAITLPSRVARAEARLAIALVLTMVVDLAGVVTWWVTEARFAPTVLVGRGASGLFAMLNVAPPALLVAGVLMMLGLAVAATGVRRLTRALNDK